MLKDADLAQDFLQVRFFLKPLCFIFPFFFSNPPLLLTSRFEGTYADGCSVVCLHRLNKRTFYVDTLTEHFVPKSGLFRSDKLPSERKE
jgi:hypothetical protein